MLTVSTWVKSTLAGSLHTVPEKLIIMWALYFEWRLIRTFIFLYFFLGPSFSYISFKVFSLISALLNISYLNFSSEELKFWVVSITIIERCGSTWRILVSSSFNALRTTEISFLSSGSANSNEGPLATAFRTMLASFFKPTPDYLSAPELLPTAFSTVLAWFLYLAVAYSNAIPFWEIA